MTKPRSKDFMETLINKVEEEYELDREFLMKFFIEKEFLFDQTKELTNSLRRAVFYLRRDADERKKWEKPFINYIREKQKLDIKELDVLLNIKDKLESISSDKTIYLRALVKKEVEVDRKNAIPRSGHQNVFFLALCQFFFTLKKYGLGQTEQVNLAYDLFVYYELDDYGTEYDKGDTYIGEIEQKERIRKRFQEPAMKYFETFDDHYGWG